MDVIKFELMWIAVLLLVITVQLRKIYERMPTPESKQAVATQAASAEVGEKAGELARSEGNSRA